MGYFDLGRKLKFNRPFRDILNSQLEEIKGLQRDPEKRAELRTSVFKHLETCNYNAATLVPMYFPRSDRTEKGTGKPIALKLLDRPYTLPLLDMRMGAQVTLLTGRQVGKSSTLIIRNKIVSDIIPNYGTLYVAPHPIHLKTFTNRYRKMEGWYQWPQVGKKLRNNLDRKENNNGSITEMVHALDDATPLRGKSADEVDIDEYQSFDPNHEYELRQVMRASEYKNVIRTGTALTVDNPLNLKFEEGSQGRWVIPCAFGHYTHMGVTDHILKCIRPDGMYCVPCRIKGWKTRINPVDGFYDHAFPERADEGHVSLHAPQLIVPAFCNDPVEWLQIYDDFVGYPTERFLQEVCGIATDAATREITRDDLMAICDDSLGNYEERKRKAREGYYKWVISGCDWGGSDHNAATKTKQSYTYHCILGITPAGRIDILHFEQHAGMRYEEIAEKIAWQHKQFRAHALASDFGAGMAYNMLIRKHIPAARHFVFNYTAPNTAALATPQNDHMFNQFSLNKTEAITTLYLAIKSARIRCFGWKEAEKHLLQFLNLARVPVDKEYGSMFKYIRHGIWPDDALHACGFAYAMLRVVINEGIVVDPSLRAEISRRMTLTDQSAVSILGYPSGAGYYGG